MCAEHYVRGRKPRLVSTGQGSYTVPCMFCDLHMHSTVSDGSLPVRELVRAVHRAGVSLFALTDHDSVQGHEEALAEANLLGIKLIAGVEVSTRLDKHELHILGYGFDPEHPALAEHLSAQRSAREGRI